jgi:hypothetical protein
LALRVLSLVDRENIPIQTCRVINDVLYDLYPPAPELLPASIQFLHRIKDIIASASRSLVVPILTTLSTSLCRWIEDSLVVFSDEEYNNVVRPHCSIRWQPLSLDSQIIPLYRHSLSMLQSHTPSLEVLNSLASLFVSVFVRIPPPASGPIAFETFWKETYHGLPQFRDQYPDNIRSCLIAFDDVFRDDISLNFSSEIEAFSHVCI